MPCNCLTRMNDALKPHHVEVCHLLPLWDGDPAVEIATEKLPSAPRRYRVPKLFASFCPFCGLEYQSVKSIGEFNAECRQRQAGAPSAGADDPGEENASESVRAPSHSD